MHHRRYSTDHHRHHKREHGGHCEQFGRHGRVGRHHSPHVDRDRCTRRGKHHGSGRFNDISYHILNETEVRNIIGENPNSKDQIRQIVREFFRRGHEQLADSNNETAAREEKRSREGEFDGRHFRGRRGRRGNRWEGWTYGPCNVEQGRTNEGPNDSEEEHSANRPYGWHYRSDHKEKGRSTQEETSDNHDEAEHEEMDSSCRKHKHDHFEGSTMHHDHHHHHFRGWRRHDRCYVIFVDSPSFTRIATEEADKEVSQSSAPMESSEANQHQGVQEAENQEVEEVAENLGKSRLE